ncbi:hypothetical protein EVJ58_g9919 [Rhodofomes roseus]|uniref:Uncharacterized protein n=1 Tax=Rhodofomes roseus TaxID=34475 RepID=A0A4Y9XT71_9APHY|nr:hypothetical protein EVJ58_g9919 [Rhodofomes roseus]
MSAPINIPRHTVGTVYTDVSPYEEVVRPDPTLPRGYVHPSVLAHLMREDEVSTDRVYRRASCVLGSLHCVQRGSFEDEHGRCTIFTCRDSSLALQNPDELGTGIAQGDATVYFRQGDRRPSDRFLTSTVYARDSSPRSLRGAGYTDYLEPRPPRPTPYSQPNLPPTPVTPRNHGRRNHARRAAQSMVAPRTTTTMHAPHAIGVGAPPYHASAFDQYAYQPSTFPTPYSSTIPERTTDPRIALAERRARQDQLTARPQQPWSSYVPPLPSLTRMYPYHDDVAVLRAAAVGSAAGCAAVTSSSTLPHTSPGPAAPAPSSASSALARSTSPRLQYPPSRAASPSTPATSPPPLQSPSPLTLPSALQPIKAIKDVSMEEDGFEFLDPAETKAKARELAREEGEHSPTPEERARWARADELDSDTIVIDAEDLPNATLRKGESTSSSPQTDSKPAQTFRELLAKVSEEYEPHNEADSSYETDDATTSKVRRFPDMEILLHKLTDATTSATHPMDRYTIDVIRIALVKAYRAVRARARREGLADFRQQQTAKRTGKKASKKNGHYARKPTEESFRTNHLLHEKEREGFGELRAFFSGQRTTDPQRQLDDTDTVLALIDAALAFDPTHEYALVLRSLCMRGDFGGPGEYPGH